MPDLVEHLARLDYPKTKLQILLLIEADDRETRAAMAEHVTAPHFEIVTVPRPAGPRTKPKALDLCAVLRPRRLRRRLRRRGPAGARPAPQGRRRFSRAAGARLRAGAARARQRDSWLARMFTVEYAANFEVLLPALAEWRVPLPLGGTSNHFPRAVLEKVAAWDPFNVTEDADLGIRLARFGYRTATILSRTYEEAPVTFRQWLPQRRRWIKGWIQTVALCLGRGIRPASAAAASPAACGARRADRAACSACCSIPLRSGSIAVGDRRRAAPAAGPTSPLQLVLARAQCRQSLRRARGGRRLGAARARARARLLRLVWHIPLLPLYWALMSLAAWQALFQFFRKPSALGEDDARRRARGGARRAACAF